MTPPSGGGTSGGGTSRGGGGGGGGAGGGADREKTPEATKKATGEAMSFDRIIVCWSNVTKAQAWQVRFNICLHFRNHYGPTIFPFFKVYTLEEMGFSDWKAFKDGTTNLGRKFRMRERECKPPAGAGKKAGEKAHFRIFAKCTVGENMSCMPYA